MSRTLREAAAHLDPVADVPAVRDLADDLDWNGRPPSPVSVRRLLSHPDDPPDLDAWLDDHPDVRKSIVWQTPAISLSYPFWLPEWKDELADAFEAAWRREPTGLADPPPNRYDPDDDEDADTVLSADDARSLFVALAGHSLAVEARGWVPWSLADDGDDARFRLLDSRASFRWRVTRLGYELVDDHWSVPAPPDVAFAFLLDEDLIGPTRRDTVGRVLDWCRHNMYHFTGGPNAENVEDHWGYRGWPPASRVIAGTVHDGRPEDGRQHYTAGCRGTTAFLHEVLRVVNVPVDEKERGGHAMPHFLGIDRYLTHGDDPYNQLTRATPPYPATELLVRPETFEGWLGSDLSYGDQQANVGRQVYELAVEHLPNYLVDEHCSDRAAGRPPGESEVFETLERYHSLSELRDADLWERLDDKVAGFGGCDSLPWRE